MLSLLLSTLLYAQSAGLSLDGNRLLLPGPVLFETGSATLKTESEASLSAVVSYLAEKSYVSTLRVEGHAEDQALSEARALAVSRWLVSKGVACSRLLPVGFGPTKPVADASTVEGRAQNVRIELVNAALMNRPIGGMPLDGGGRVAGDPCK
ncbi:MAG TPA: OmpA family protein [Myxococcota bacterium]|nr:OmpA family protein [Myxococcota bacterium]